MILGTYGNGATTVVPIIQDFLASLPDAKPTELCSIMAQAGSDKGTGWHNYTLLYDWLFRDKRDAVRTVFELGLGSNDTSIPCAGTQFTTGGSLRGWRSYFPNAECFGADVDRKALFREERIDTFYVNSTDNRSIDAMWSLIRLQRGDLHGGPLRFDFMLDDGLHSFASNSTFLTASKTMLAPGGYYIIEDIHINPPNLGHFDGYLQHIGMDGVLLHLPNQQNHQDNCLAILRSAE
jgi:hypothetical protein